MKRILPFIIISSILMSGCGVSHEDFVKDSGDFYVEMFKEGSQTEEINDLYNEYIEKYDSRKFKEDELFKAIEGMYHGLADGTATEHQLKAMRLLNE